MADNPWFKFYQNDWLATQGELNGDEQLVFQTVLILIYANDKAIHTDAEQIARRCRISRKRAALALERLIDIGKLKKAEEGRITNSLAEKVMAERQKRAQLKSDVGRARAEKRWGKAKQNQVVSHAEGIDDALLTDTPSMEEQNKKEKQKENENENVYLETAYKENFEGLEEVKTSLPADFSLTEDRVAEAMRIGHSRTEANDAFEQFIDFHKRDDVPRADWEAAWRYWCRVRKRLPRHQQRSSSLV